MEPRSNQANHHSSSDQQKLQALAPLISRVGGDATRTVLAPDIAIPDQPQKPRAMIERLLTRLGTVARQTGQ